MQCSPCDLDQIGTRRLQGRTVYIVMNVAMNIVIELIGNLENIYAQITRENGNERENV